MASRMVLHYRILKLVGKGAMGEVYLAEDTRLKRTVALKVLRGHLREDQESFRRFKIEAEAAARLNHPNIATLYTVEEVDGQWIIAMEYIEGTVLKDRIPQEGLALEVFFDWFLPLAEALAHAHERGVTHRDIKPANITITGENTPKILDFGLARIRPAGGAEAVEVTAEETLTQVGTIMGSPAYMSPEQAAGGKTDHRTDIFSFGIVMYEALTGKRPFKGQTIEELITSILRDQPVSVAALRPGLPRLLGHVVNKTLQKDLRKRYQTAQDVVNDLRVARLEGDEGMEAGDAAETIRINGKVLPWRRQPGRRFQMLAGVFLVLVGAFLGWFLSRGKPQPLEESCRVYRIPMEGTSSAVTGGGPAISPDGRTIAYVQDERLWLMDLGTGQSVEVPDAANVELQPFWSPDSLNVGYFTDMGRIIRKLSVKARQSVTLCDLSALGYGSSATWGSRGDIVFDLWRGDWTRGQGLMTVSHEGGNPEPLLPPDPDKRITYQAPSYLPDARGLLHVAVHPEGCSELMVRSNGVSRSLLKCTEGKIFYPIYCPSGYLLYQKGLGNEYGIWAVPFSLERLETTGDSFLVAGSGAWPSVSSDGTLTYMYEPPFKQQLVWLNRTGQVLSSIGPSMPGTQIGGFSLSPDQRRVAMDAFETTDEDIWVVDIARGTKARFAFSSARDAEGTWSPDGSHLAFSSEREGMSDLFVQPADPGSKARLLIQGGADTYNPHWCPNGNFLIYEMVNPKTKRDLWYLPLKVQGESSSEGPERQPFLYLQTPFDEAAPQFSPDCRWVAYMSNVSGRWEVYVRSFPEGAGEWLISVQGGRYPRWSSRGDELYYVEGNALMNAKVHTKPGFRVEVPEKLFERKHLGLYFTRRYDASADGLRFIAVEEASEGRRYMSIMEHWHRASALKDQVERSGPHIQ